MSPENAEIAVSLGLQRKSGLRREKVRFSRAKRVFLAVLVGNAGLRAGADRAAIDQNLLSHGVLPERARD